MRCCWQAEATHLSSGKVLAGESNTRRSGAKPTRSACCSSPSEAACRTQDSGPDASARLCVELPALLTTEHWVTQLQPGVLAVCLLWCLTLCSNFAAGSLLACTSACCSHCAKPAPPTHLCTHASVSEHLQHLANWICLHCHGVQRATCDIGSQAARVVAGRRMQTLGWWRCF